MARNNIARQCILLILVSATLASESSKTDDTMTQYYYKLTYRNITFGANYSVPHHANHPNLFAAFTDTMMAGDAACSDDQVEVVNTCASHIHMEYDSLNSVQRMIAEQSRLVFGHLMPGTSAHEEFGAHSGFGFGPKPLGQTEEVANIFATYPVETRSLLRRTCRGIRTMIKCARPKITHTDCNPIAYRIPHAVGSVICSKNRDLRPSFAEFLFESVDCMSGLTKTPQFEQCVRGMQRKLDRLFARAFEGDDISIGDAICSTTRRMLACFRPLTSLSCGYQTFRFTSILTLKILGAVFNIKHCEGVAKRKGSKDRTSIHSGRGISAVASKHPNPDTKATHRSRTMELSIFPRPTRGEAGQKLGTKIDRLVGEHHQNFPEPYHSAAQSKAILPKHSVEVPSAEHEHALIDTTAVGRSANVQHISEPYHSRISRGRISVEDETGVSSKDYDTYMPETIGHNRNPKPAGAESEPYHSKVSAVISLVDPDEMQNTPKPTRSSSPYLHRSRQHRQPYRVAHVDKTNLNMYTSPNQRERGRNRPTRKRTEWKFISMEEDLKSLEESSIEARTPYSPSHESFDTSELQFTQRSGRDNSDNRRQRNNIKFVSSETFTSDESLYSGENGRDTQTNKQQYSYETMGQIVPRHFVKQSNEHRESRTASIAVPGLSADPRSHWLLISAEDLGEADFNIPQAELHTSLLNRNSGGSLIQVRNSKKPRENSSWTLVESTKSGSAAHDGSTSSPDSQRTSSQRSTPPQLSELPYSVQSDLNDKHRSSNSNGWILVNNDQSDRDRDSWVIVESDK